LPLGCVGDQCDFRPQRPDSATADAFYVVGLALLVLAAVGLAVLVLRRRRLGRLGALAVGLIAVGAVVAVVASVVQSAFYDGDLPAMPAIFLPAGSPPWCWDSRC
jgi:lipopolysaccharide export LptBFGC system permease protein LptF